MPSCFHSWFPLEKVIAGTFFAGTTRLFQKIALKIGFLCLKLCLNVVIESYAYLLVCFSTEEIIKNQRQCALQTQETSAMPDLGRSWHGSFYCYFFEPKLGASTL